MTAQIVHEYSRVSYDPSELGARNGDDAAYYGNIGEAGTLWQRVAESGDMGSAYAVGIANREFYSLRIALAFVRLANKRGNGAGGTLADQRKFNAMFGGAKIPVLNGGRIVAGTRVK